jgi:predicted permease
VAVGVVSQERWAQRTQAVTKRVLDAMLYLALPYITFFVIASTEFDTGAGVGLLLAYTELTVVGLLAWLLARRVFHLGRTQTATMIIGVILVNTGYLGVPLNRALLGADALGPAITFDAIVSGPMFYVFGFAIAAALTTHGEPLRARVRAFVTRNPPLVAVVLALLAPDALAPDVLVNIARDGVFVLLPLGFFILGVNLAAERDEGAFAFPPPLTAPVATVVGLRMVVAPALMAGLAAVTVDVPDAYLLQAGMPVGINSLVIAHAYGLDLQIMSSAVAWSTTVAVLAGLASLAV